MLCVSDTVSRDHLAKLCLEAEHQTQKPEIQEEIGIATVGRKLVWNY